MILFVFFVVELWLGWIACKNLFAGVQYLAVRHNGDIALKGFDVARFFVIIFLVIKNVANFLPAGVTVLFPDIDSDPDTVDNFTAMARTFQTVRSILFVVGAISVLALGIYTARVILAYLYRLRSDSVFVENLQRAYETKVVHNDSMQIRIAVRGAFRLFFASFFFLADVYLDDIGLIPTVLMPLLAYFGMTKLSRAVELPNFYRPIALASFGISLAAYLFRTVALFNVESFGVFFVLSRVALILGLLTAVSSALVGLLMIRSVELCAKKYMSYSNAFAKFTVPLSILALCTMGFFQYRYPSTFAVLPFIQWGVFFVGLYYHKTTMDAIADEVDFKLM